MSRYLILIFLALLVPIYKVSANQLNGYQYELVFGNLDWFQRNILVRQQQAGIIGLRGYTFLSFLDFYNLAYKKNKESKLELSPAVFITQQLFNVQSKLGFSAFLIKGNVHYPFKDYSFFTKCTYMVSERVWCRTGLQLRWKKIHWPGFGLATGKNFLLSYNYKHSYLSAGVELLFKGHLELTGLNLRLSFRPAFTKITLTQQVISPLSKKQQVPPINILLNWGVSLDGAIQLQKHRDICRMNKSDKVILSGKNWRC